MGNLAESAREITQASPQNDFKNVLATQWEKIAAVMPRHMSEERMYQLAVSAYNSTPQLAQCSIVSVLSCVMKCAALGLEPSAVDGLGRAYILPYRNRKTGGYEAQFIMGYKGILQLARNSGEIESISARAVYEGDEFSYSYGLHEDLQHVPSNAPKDGRELTHAYCIAKFKDGGHYFNVLTREDIEKARKSSQAGNSKYSPWATHYEQMAVKTAVRRAFPYLPVSIEAQSAAAADETTPDYTSVLAPVVPQADILPVEAETAENAPTDTETGEEADSGETMSAHAVCKTCGNVLSVAPDATAQDIAFQCCEAPNYEIQAR